MVIRLVVVDDHAMVREGLVTALETDGLIEVVGSAGSLAEALPLLVRLRPDVAVVDLNLVDGSGTELVRGLPPDQPTRIVIITGKDDRRGLDAAVSSGCAGFVSKGKGLEHLVNAVRAVATGASVFPADLLSQLLSPDPQQQSPLSERERQVLELLARAETAETIAERLYLSVHTVRNHIRAILAKLGATSQLEAVVQGVRAGYVRIQ